MIWHNQGNGFYLTDKYRIEKLNKGKKVAWLLFTSDLRLKGKFKTFAEAKKEAELDKAVAKRQRIDKALNKLNPRYRYLVRAVAIERKSIRRTANDLKYNYNYAIGLFHKCIEELKI